VKVDLVVEVTIVINMNVVRVNHFAHCWRLTFILSGLLPSLVVDMPETSTGR
jgi:hypothetical protein